MRIFRNPLVGVAVAVTTVAGLTPAALASPAPAAATARWHVATSFRKPGFLFSIAAPTGRDVWVLGSASPKLGSENQFPAGLHWNGRRWSPVSARSFPKLIRKFNPGIVTGCLVISPTQIWVFGDAHVAPGTGTWHLSGKTWTHLDTGRYALAAASAIKPDDVWAEGENGFAFPVVAHWNGSKWLRNQKLTAALPKDTASRELFADGIAALSDKDVLLRALEQVNGSTKIVVLRWNGHAWGSVKRSDPDFNLPGAVPDGHGGWWTVSPTSPGTLLHEVHGHWTRVPLRITGCPESPFAVANATGTSVMLGVQACGEHQNVLSFGKLP